MSSQEQTTHFGGIPIKSILNPKLSYTTQFALHEHVPVDIYGLSDPENATEFEYSRFHTKAIVDLIEKDELPIDDEEELKILQQIAEHYDYIEFY